MEANLAVRMVNITKTFSHVVANNNITLEIRRGEILSLLGENGSGKTTLMNMLSGIYFPDSGQIYALDEQLAVCQPGSYPAVPFRQLYSSRLRSLRV